MMDGSGQSALYTADPTTARAADADLTELKNPGESTGWPSIALAQTEETYRHIIESLPGGVIHIASDGAFLGANTEALRFLGMSLDALTHRIVPDYSGETFYEDGSPCPVEDYPASRCLASGRAQIEIFCKNHLAIHASTIEGFLALIGSIS